MHFVMRLNSKKLKSFDSLLISIETNNI